MRKGIGFYWTLPVKWAGFERIGSDADQAARESRTIALQRDVVRRWAKQYGYELVEERAFIEQAPDRGSDRAVQEAAALAERAKAMGAQVLYVDFGQALGQRTHHLLRGYMGRHEDLFEPIWPDHAEEQAFRDHFATWREAQAQWTEGKPARIAAARARAEALRDEGHKLDAVAWQLEQEGLRSPTGKPWTAEMVRKVLKQEG